MSVFLGDDADPPVPTLLAWNPEDDNGAALVDELVVAGAGDTNCDGHSDVLVGAPDSFELNVFEGAAFVYFGSVGGLPDVPGWFQKGSPGSTDRFGEVVAAAGDVDGNGCFDIVVGAEDNVTSQQELRLYEGSGAGPSTSSGWFEDGGWFSISDNAINLIVAPAGDVNGDGYGDLLVSNPESGDLFLFAGDQDGLAVANPNPVWQITSYSGAGITGFGSSIAAAGDVNGDGYSDIIVGAKDHGTTEDDEGFVQVYLGSASWLSTTYDWETHGNQPYAYYGTAVATAGDVNNDGFSDVIAGAPGFYFGSPGEGIAFVYMGLPELNATPYDTITGQPDGGPGDFNRDGYADFVSAEGIGLGGTSGLAPYRGWCTIGCFAPDFSPYDVTAASAIQDIDGDGDGDAVTGSPNYGNGETNEGALHVYLGPSVGIGAPFDFAYESDIAGAQLGESVAFAGDVNGDGRADVVAGAPGYANGENNEGAAYLYLGNADGSLSLYSGPGWPFESNVVDARLGETLAGVGDVNQDGFADFIVGAPAYSNGQTGEGAAWLFLGSAGGPTLAPGWPIEGEQTGRCIGQRPGGRARRQRGRH